MPDPLVMAALFCALLGLICLLAVVAALKRRKVFGTLLSFLSALLMLALAGLFFTVQVSIQGYRALTNEQVAATVKAEPTGVQQFSARFTMPDGSEKTFALAGDQLYVDAHILKWKPIVALLGLHTAYELDRVSGRYERLEDERIKPRTIFSLAQPKLVDLFALRRKYQFLEPLVDAEYGSAAFIGSNRPEEFKIMVSTTGLLVRKGGEENR
jgi:hypothetical protein